MAAFTSSRRSCWVQWPHPGRMIASCSLGTNCFSAGTSWSIPLGDVGMVPRAGGILSGRPVPDILPSWITEEDIEFYAGEFIRAGFRGGLNWYRNIDRNWELMSP
jgi:hypothetical protein